MVETTTRPKCAQNTPDAVMVEDQLDAATASKPRTLADAGRDFAAAWRKYDSLNSLTSEPPEEEAARLHQAEIGAEIRSGTLPVTSTEDAIVELMCCFDTMLSRTGPDGIGLVDTMPLLERLRKLIFSLARAQGVTPSELGCDGFCIDEDDIFPFYERYLALKALDAGLVFHVAPGGEVTLYGDVKASPPEVLQQIDDYDLKYVGLEAKGLLCERDHVFLPRGGNADERLRGKHWWLSQGSLTRDNTRMLEPLRVSFGPPPKDWAAIQQERQIISLCDQAIEMENRISAMLKEDPENEERIQPLDAERMEIEAQIRTLMAKTIPAQQARLRLLKERCAHPGYAKHEYASHEMALSSALLRDFIGMIGEGA